MMSRVRPDATNRYKSRAFPERNGGPGVTLLSGCVALRGSVGLCLCGGKSTSRTEIRVTPVVPSICRLRVLITFFRRSGGTKPEIATAYFAYFLLHLSRDETNNISGEIIARCVLMAVTGPEREENCDTSWEFEC